MAIVQQGQSHHYQQPPHPLQHQQHSQDQISAAQYQQYQQLVQLQQQQQQLQQQHQQMGGHMAVSAGLPVGVPGGAYSQQLQQQLQLQQQQQQQQHMMPPSSMGIALAGDMGQQQQQQQQQQQMNANLAAAVAAAGGTVVSAGMVLSHHPQHHHHQQQHQQQHQMLAPGVHRISSPTAGTVMAMMPGPLSGGLADPQGLGGGSGDGGVGGMVLGQGGTHQFQGGGAGGGQAGEYMNMMMAGGMEGQQPPAKVRMSGRLGGSAIVGCDDRLASTFLVRGFGWVCHSWLVTLPLLYS